MAKKRLPNEGSVFCRKNKKLWVSRNLIPQPDGTKKRHEKCFKTRKDAMSYHIQVLHDIQMGHPVLSDSYTVGSFLKHWYDNYCIDIRDSTRMGVETALFRHVESPQSTICPCKRQIPMHGRHSSTI